ncbi:hypothetical protein Lal_00032254 [Lupinus albus]|nr:hypothetical protein Lal_00032254 [Lupinus albus]
MHPPSLFFAPRASTNLLFSFSLHIFCRRISDIFLSLSFRGTRVGTGFQYCRYFGIGTGSHIFGCIRERPGCDSATKRLKESDLVVTQPRNDLSHIMSTYKLAEVAMEMENKQLAVMFIDLGDDLTSSECCHSTSTQLVSISVER